MKTPQVIGFRHNGTGNFKVCRFFFDKFENVVEYVIAPDVSPEDARVIVNAFKSDNYKAKTIKPQLCAVFYK